MPRAPTSDFARTLSPARVSFGSWNRSKPPFAAKINSLRNASACAGIAHDLTLSVPARDLSFQTRWWLFRLRHSGLPAMLAALILLAFQIVFFWHWRSPAIRTTNALALPSFRFTVRRLVA